MDINPLQKAVNAAEIAPERLAGNTALNEQQKIAEASRQFEAILLRQILAATQKTVIPSKFADNSTSADIYRDMITTQLADSISKSGSFGLAKTFEHQLTHPAAALSASAFAGTSLGVPASAGLTPQSSSMHPVHAQIRHDAFHTERALGHAQPHAQNPIPGPATTPRG